MEFLLQLGDGFQDYVTDDGEAARADFVERVLRRVPIACGDVIVEVDDIDSGHAAREKRLVVVFDGGFLRDEDIFVSEACMRSSTRGR